MIRVRHISGTVLLLLLSSVSLAQEVLVTRIQPDLPIYPQYFSVEQGADGALYVGHDQAVLRFDGNRWDTIELPAAGAVRELERDGRGRIWVGGTNCFGYLERDVRGVDRFVDLTPRFTKALAGDQFGDVWRMLVTDDQVFFGALNHLFALSLDGQPLGLWRHQGRFGAMAEIEGVVFAQWRGEGIKRLSQDGHFELVSNDETFSSSLILSFLDVGSGKTLIHTRSLEMVTWKPGQPDLPPQPVAIQNSDPLRYLTDGLAADANTIVFGGSDGTVRVLDLPSGEFQEAPLARGFLSDVSVASDGAVLVVSNDGVLHMPWPAAWVKYASSSELRGSIHRLVQLEDTLYALAGAGVSTAKLNNGQITGEFQRQEWSEGETWDLLQTGSGLLLADAHELRQIDAQGSRRIGPDNLYPRHLLTPAENPDLLWTGNEHGLALFSNANGGWQLVHRVEQMGMRITSLVEAGDGSLWVGTDGFGLQKARLNANGEASFTLLPAEGLAADVVADDGYTLVSASSIGMLLSTSNGTYRLTGAGFVADDLGGLSEFKPVGEAVSFLDGPNGSIWAHSYRALYSRRAGFWSVTDLSKLDSGVVNAVTMTEDGSLWLGGAAEVFHYKPEPAPKVEAGTLGLSALILSGRHRAAPERLPLTGSLELEGQRLTVKARLSLSELAPAGTTRYRTRLLGLSDQWSEWQNQGEVSYVGIGPGRYTLQAEAVTGAGRVHVMTPRSFVVAPRWFESSWLRFAGALLAVALLILAVTAYQRRQVTRLALRNQELDDLVRQRTGELRAANRKLRDQAERDALTGVGNRRLFDQQLADCFGSAQDNGVGVALLLVDVDHFKQYNDTYGHQAGDWVLSKLASVLAANVRDDTVVARYGGEEFGLVVPRCDNLSAARLARRLVQQVAEELDNITVSIGVAGFAAERDGRPEDLIARADEALYTAKRQGRNRFVLAA